MRVRFLALGLLVAWPSFAHANWFDDTIGRPITGGLSQGAHAFSDSMVTGAKQTRGAFGSAAHGVGIDWPQSDQARGRARDQGDDRQRRQAVDRSAGRQGADEEPAGVPAVTKD